MLVNRPVDLHDEASFGAHEVDDVRANRMLTTESPATELTPP
jgi:hypothetical protein